MELFSHKKTDWQANTGCHATCSHGGGNYQFVSTIIKPKASVWRNVTYVACPHHVHKRAEDRSDKRTGIVLLRRLRPISLFRTVAKAALFSLLTDKSTVKETFSDNRHLILLSKCLFYWYQPLELEWPAVALSPYWRVSEEWWYIKTLTHRRAIRQRYDRVLLGAHTSPTEATISTGGFDDNAPTGHQSVADV